MNRDIKVTDEVLDDLTSSEVFIIMLLRLVNHESESQNIPVIDYLKSNHISPELYYDAVVELRGKGLRI